MEALQAFWAWFCSWSTDATITTWVKANAIITGVMVVAVRTIANRTKTTIDNEFLGRLRDRFGLDKNG